MIAAMRFLDVLALAFFRTFGITEPAEKSRRTAANFLLGIIFLIAAGFFAGAAILFHIL